MSNSAKDDSADLIRPIYLVDRSKAEEGESGELGHFDSVVVGYIEKVEDSLVTSVVTARLQPRSLHFIKGPKFEGSALEDWRAAPMIVVDHEHDFPGFGPTRDPKNVLEHDWSHENRSTRLADYKNPRGRVALAAQLIKVVDALGGANAPALVLGREVGEHEVAPAGYVYDNGNNRCGLLDTWWITHHDEMYGKGRENTQSGILGGRTDAHWIEVGRRKWHGPIFMDGQIVEDRLRLIPEAPLPDPGDPKKMFFKTRLLPDPSVANFAPQELGRENCKWRDYFFVPFFEWDRPPTDGGDGGRQPEESIPPPSSAPPFSNPDNSFSVPPFTPSIPPPFSSPVESIPVESRPTPSPPTESTGGGGFIPVPGPKGDKGDKGDPGPKGDKGEKGDPCVCDGGRGTTGGRDGALPKDGPVIIDEVPLESPGVPGFGGPTGFGGGVEPEEARRIIQSVREGFVGGLTTPEDGGFRPRPGPTTARPGGIGGPTGLIGVTGLDPDNPILNPLPTERQVGDDEEVSQEVEGEDGGSPAPASTTRLGPPQAPANARGVVMNVPMTTNPPPRAALDGPANGNAKVALLPAARGGVVIVVGRQGPGEPWQSPMLPGGTEVLGDLKVGGHVRLPGGVRIGRTPTGGIGVGFDPRKPMIEVLPNAVMVNGKPALSMPCPSPAGSTVVATGHKNPCFEVKEVVQLPDGGERTEGTVPTIQSDGTVEWQDPPTAEVTQAELDALDARVTALEGAGSSSIPGLWGDGHAG